MAAQTVQDLPRNGSLADLAFTAVDGGLSDTFVNDGQTIAIIQNGDAGVHDVTPTVVGNLGGMVTETGVAVTVAAGATTILGPFDRDVFNGAGSAVTLTFDAATSMTIAVVKYPI